MKSNLLFLKCLTMFYFTLSDSSNVVLNLKENRNQLGNQMDKAFLRRGKNHKGKHTIPLSEAFSNLAVDAQRITGSWVDKQSIQPDTETNKAENPNDDKKKAIYSFNKEVASGHQDKKAAQRYRNKTNVLKENKRTEHHNFHVRNEHKEKKYFIKRKNPHKKALMYSIEKLDAILNIPTHGIQPGNIAKEFYEIDPVLNILQSNINSRRQVAKEEDSSSQLSSTQEIVDFKENFRDLWLEKKYEALNATMPAGDEVNMGGARPWGVRCGDPTQHSLPWGTCMLSVECEVEYRIFRGDVYCGRTSFVCCALELTTYDMYQGFDVSFEGKSLSMDSEEIFRNPNKGRHNRKKRRHARRIRKRKIKKTIKRIIKEMQSILNRIYQNASKQRKKKTKQLQRFIKFLKSEYKKNRHVVQELHEHNIVKIDGALMKKLYDIKDMNHNFMKNKTFAEIVVNGTMTKEGARMLIQAYPELQEFIESTPGPSLGAPKMVKTRSSHGKSQRVRLADVRNRRFGGAIPDSKEKTVGMDEKIIKPKGDYLEYDVEYGFLYY